MTASSASAARPRSISLDDLILLNDEVLGLIAAGVPLDVGLSGSASRMSGRLRQWTSDLADRISRGMSLEQALADESGGVPDEYRLIVAAGVRAGRFEEILSSFRRYAADVRDLRAALSRALIYPAVVGGLSFGLLVGVIALLVPELLQAARSFELPTASWIVVLESLNRTVLYWGIGIPAVALGLLVAAAAVRFWGVLPARRNRMGRFLGLLGWVPGVGGAIRHAEWSRFAQLLAILLEARTPLPEAARLSAAAVLNRRGTRTIEEACRRVEAGEPLASALATATQVPPVLRWLIGWGELESGLPIALREAAAHYRQRAIVRAEWVQRIVPAAIVLLVGGGITAAYALSVFVPLSWFWKTIAA